MTRYPTQSHNLILSKPVPSLLKSSWVRDEVVISTICKSLVWHGRDSNLQLSLWEVSQYSYQVDHCIQCTRTSWMDLWKNEWISESVWLNGGWMDEWMNGWMNEWMNEWVNEWMSEWMNEWKMHKWWQTNGDLSKHTMFWYVAWKMAKLVEARHLKWPSPVSGVA